MSELTVEPVVTRRQRKAFLELPWRLYRADPLWVPPLRRDQQELVGYRRHPFYEKNESQTFLALRGGEVVGRIAAVHNRAHNEYCGDDLGFFGFFECADDLPAARALLDAAAEWLARRGLRRVRGPVNPSLNYTAGLLVEGFDLPPAVLMPYNPPYYARLIEACGFGKAQDLYAYHGHRRQLAEAQAKLDPVADQIAERYGIRIRRMSRWRFRRDVADFLEVLNRSLVGHWGFVPFSPAEVAHMAKGLSWLLVPEAAIGAEIDGRLVGVALMIPDYSRRIRRIDGRLFPFGIFRLLARKRAIRRHRVVAANVLPEYRLHGVSMVLFQQLAQWGIRFEAEEVEFGWIAESNRISYGSLEKGGAQRVKTYRIYDRDG
jgi:hypothetical protein